MQRVIFQDLGKIAYQEAWDYQEKLFQELVARKLRNRDLAESEKEASSHYLLFCEHPPVYTLGRSGKEEHLLAGQTELEQLGASFYKNNRGGDITFHGPGQIVGYPILDLEYFFTDIHRYLRLLEEAIILTLSDWKIHGERFPGYTGVWIDAQHPLKARKICAMGVRCSRWVTMHGFALNVNTDLSFFNHIVPCGIENKAVTSMSQEFGKRIDEEEVKSVLRKHLATLFEIELEHFAG